jgi:hypothetical protein
MTESAGAISTLLRRSASDWLRLVSHILSTEYNIIYPGDNQIVKLAPLTEIARPSGRLANLSSFRHSTTELFAHPTFICHSTNWCRSCILREVSEHSYDTHVRIGPSSRDDGNPPVLRTVWHSIHTFQNMSYLQEAPRSLYEGANCDGFWWPFD